MTATTTILPAAPRAARLRRLSWVTWRQQRASYVAVLALLGALAILLVVTGSAIRHARTQLGLSACGALNGAGCQVRLSIFESRYETWAQYLPRFLTFLPAALGVFIGGPLVARELESGTFRFAWTQSRTRSEWLVAKLVLLIVPVTAAAFAFSVLISWWFAPFEPIMGRMAGGQAYEVTGTVFAARTAFALSLGVLVGALVRRVVAAMAVSGLVWLAVAWPSTIYLRPLIQAPIDVHADSNLITSGGWTTAEWFQAPGGAHIGVKSQQLAGLYHRAAASGVTTDHGFTAYLARHGYVHWASYQPENRFWHFQLVESGGYVALAIGCAVAAVWWVRRTG